MEQQGMTFDDFREALKRRKWSIILPAITIFGIAVLLAVALPRTYKSISTILIEEQEIPREFVSGIVAGYAEQRLQSINQQVMSAPKLMEIINRFNLYKELKNKLSVEEIINKMRKDIKFETISADVGKAKAATIAFSLSYSGKTPGEVQQVANVLASLYLEENIRVRQQQTGGTMKFLEEEMNAVQAELAGIDAKIAAFKRRNLDALPELSQVNLQGSDRLEFEIDRLNDQLRTLMERERYLETQLAATPAELADGDKARLRELKLQLGNLKSRFSDEYPDVIKTKNEIASLQKQMQSAGKDTSPAKPDNPAYVTLDSQLASTRSEIDSVKRQVELATQKKGGYRRRIEASPRVEEGYKTLAGERNNLQLKYDDLMKKYMEAKVASGLEKGQMGERFTIIDPARLPEKPVSPNVPAIIFIGLILGVGVGVGLAAFQEFNDQSVRTPEALTRATGLTVLASIPEIAPWQGTNPARKRWAVVIVAILIAIAGALLLFHFFIMDLDVLWAKLSRRMGI